MRDVRPPQKPKRPQGPPIVPARKRTTQAGGRLTGSAVPVAATTIPEEAPADLFVKRKVAGSQPKQPVRLGGHERSLLLGFLALVLIVGVLFGAVFLPSADVKLVLQTSPLLVDESLRFSAAGNPGEAVPATSFFREVAIEGSIDTTGTETIGAKAGGEVVLINNTVEEQKIKERSRLITEDEVLFYMLSSATIPAQGRVSVAVEAAEAGAEGNVNDVRLNFAALDASSQSLVYAQVETPLSGGAGDVVGVVTERDRESARQRAAQQAREQVEESIRSELVAGWQLLEESWHAELADFVLGTAVGDQADQVTYSTRAIIHVLGYESDILDQKIETALADKLESEYMLFPGPVNYTLVIDAVDWDEASADASARITHTTIPQFSMNTLREKIAGRPADEAESYLQGLPGVKSVEISTAPFWVRSVPRVEGRVDIEFVPERQP